MVSQAELILKVITLWFLVLSQFFMDGMGPFKRNERSQVKNSPKISLIYLSKSVIRGSILLIG